METLWLNEIVTAVNGSCDFEYKNVKIHHVCIDSRKIIEGDLFIALEGESFDGHDFIENAIQNGASAVILSKSDLKLQEVPLIIVENTLHSLWKLSTFYRQKFCKPIIAVTGSVGKTSTKDMIAAILSAKYDVHKSHGNFNNQIGLPMTILGLEKHHDAMVVEMGMRGFDEIRELTNIAKPTIAIITNIGLSHIERLTTQENILKSKLEIVDGLDDKGILILNANDPMLCKINKKIAYRVIYVGVETDADYTAYDVVDKGEEGVSFNINLSERKYIVHIPTVGRHNVANVLFGIACGIELGMKPEEILDGIKDYQPEKMRLNIIMMDGIKFINDAYNASPDSMKAAMQVLRSVAGGHKAVAVIGNMLELGEMAKKSHQDIGKSCNSFKIDFTAVIGENATDLAIGIGDAKRCKIFSSHDEMVIFLKKYLKNGDVALIKGSRGMHMEKILDLWPTSLPD